MTNYLTDYANFTNKLDLDAATNPHVNTSWNNMNNTDRAVLNMIRQYSVKYGVAHLKHETIEKAVGKSNTTVRRAIRKLESLKIIDRIHFIRPIMSGLGANVYAIKPYNEQAEMNTPDKAEKPTSTKAQLIESKSEPLFYKALSKDLSNTYPTEQFPTTLFGRMKSFLTSTIGDGTLTRRLFGVYRQQSIPLLKFSIHEEKGELFEQLAFQALHISVQATKRKEIRNLPGYFSGILRELIDKALFGDAFMDYDLPVDGFYYG